LYPEAAIAGGTLPKNGWVVAILQRLLRPAYACCDVIADIGPCMRNLIANYASDARSLTVTPWALNERVAELGRDMAERQAAFGHARLGLMYSGNFGRAHSCEEILSLARALRGESICFAFSVRGNRVHELRRSVSHADENIRFLPFVEEGRLNARLSAADIHIVSLRKEWTGSVVPSKFFGALGAGRPVLFIGSGQSSIASWIQTHGVGWVLEPGNQAQIAADLNCLSQNPKKLSPLFEHCHRVYHEHFSRSQVIDRFESELRNLITMPSTVIESLRAEEPV
jgi:glycosyltransferase involved in cell wall biosynthesis